jgi:long-chain acyl-CoA synthetase
MSLTFDEAVAAVTAEGGRFAMTTAVVDGQELPVFAAAPPTMRAVFDVARAGGDGVFLVYEDERWTFAEVMARVDALAATLVERYGITKGDRVAVSMRNYPEWIMTYAASLSIGAVAVCLNAWWTTDEMHYGLEDSGAKVLVADEERVERVAPLLADGRTDVQVIAVRTPDPLPTGVVHLDDVLLTGAPMPDVAIDADDDATILYTSGTTGEPKGALSSHRAVISALMAFGCRATVNALMTAPAEGEEPKPAHPYPTCFILIVPLFHVTGCIPVMLSSFVAGCKLVMMRKWDPERALELIERERVTTFVGVPTMSWDLLESPDFEKRDTSSLLMVGGGGAPAPPELVRRVDKSFSSARPNIGYGMTETNAYGPQNAGDDYVRKPTSAGRTVPVMQVRVVDEAGTPVGAGEVGEIEFRGANLIRGYWNKPAATAEVFHDGWLRTGDLGRIDDEGFVYVEDRAKDMVLRGGENVYCAEIEAVLYEHGDVYEAAVFGVPHERLGEEVAAAIVVREGAVVTAEALQAHVGAKLAPFKVPSLIIFREERLPRGATGKILKRDLRDETVAADQSAPQ